MKNYDDLLKDPTTSKFIREVIRLAKDRDPVDVVNGLAVVSKATEVELANTYRVAVDKMRRERRWIVT